MKVYERNYTDFRYPDDMTKIMNYLNERGRVFVSAKTIESLYEDFSHQRCAGWLFTEDDTLEDFEEWLQDVEL